MNIKSNWIQTAASFFTQLVCFHGLLIFKIFLIIITEGRSTVHRKLLQCELHDAILGVLRKRSTLRYFQVRGSRLYTLSDTQVVKGYHDIITVLFLTLPAELVLPCAEKLSLHRLRDSMGHGLESLIGQLRYFLTPSSQPFNA